VFDRRQVLQGLAVASTALVLGRGSTVRAATARPTTPGRWYHPCFGGDGRVYVSATRASGASAIDVFDVATDGTSSLRYGYVVTGSLPGALNFPQGLTTDSSGQLYVLDCNNGRIQVFRPSSDGATLTFVRGMGSLGPKPGQFHSPQGLTWFDRWLVVADTRNHRVQYLDATTGEVALVVGEHGVGPGQFRCPTAVAIGDDGTLFVADGSNARVQVFSAMTGSRGADYVTTLTPPIRRVPAGTPGPKRAFDGPLTAVAVRGDDLYVMESTALTATKKVQARLAVYRRGSDGWTDAPDRTAAFDVKLAELERPYSFCLAPNGGVVVTDLAAAAPVRFVVEG